MGVVKVTIPDEMREEVRKLVKQGKYRSVADFFYIAGRKELDRIKEAELKSLIDADCDAEVMEEAEVV